MARADTELNATLAAIQHTLAALTERVAALESSAGRAGSDAGRAGSDAGRAGSPNRPSPPAPLVPPRDADLDPGVILAIAAAVAAYLGERAHVRQVRLISSQAWGQQGRVNVQASHTLHR